jgi:hypothetical protein
VPHDRSLRDSISSAPQRSSKLSSRYVRCMMKRQTPWQYEDRYDENSPAPDEWRTGPLRGPRHFSIYQMEEEGNVFISPAQSVHVGTHHGSNRSVAPPGTARACSGQPQTLKDQPAKKKIKTVALVTAMVFGRGGLECSGAMNGLPASASLPAVQIPCACQDCCTQYLHCVFVQSGHPISAHPVPLIKDGRYPCTRVEEWLRQCDGGADAGSGRLRW